MMRLDAMRIYRRTRLTDDRGWLLKIISGSEESIGAGIRDIYMVESHPGETRGNHYHRETREWFTVIRGRAEVVLEDPACGVQRIVVLSEEEPATLEVSPGIAHAIIATGQTPLWLVAAASLPYASEDVVPYLVGFPSDRTSENG